MLSCHQVAEYFLAQSDPDAGDLISNLKLQKLLYYAQGFHLALYNKPLFPEAIEAWTHGPVVPDCYHIYKRHKNSGIPRPKRVNFDVYDKPIRKLLDEVYSVFGQFSAWKLRNMTHEEPPWKNAAPSGGVISQRAMKDYFKTQLAS